MPWNYGDLLDQVADAVDPRAPAFVHGERKVDWRAARRRMNNLARAFVARGGAPGDKVAFYLRNGIAYAESVGATFLGRLVHVNVNYRYRPDEVRYILDNSDAKILIYATEFRAAVEEIRAALPKLQSFIEVVEEGEPAAFAEDYETIAEAGEGTPLGIKRSPEDMLFIYTGGTTGMPKGVMWQHGELCSLWMGRLERTLGAAPKSIEAFAAGVKAVGAGPVTLPACPLMHGTGFMSAMVAMLSGGCVVTVGGHHFDPDEVWRAVEAHRVQNISIVGDPFARPLLRALEEEPGRYDLSSMLTMTSSGAMWSTEVKRGLLRHLPQLTLTDNFASTEAMGMGQSVMTRDAEAETAEFAPLENALVIDEKDRPIAAGSERAGLVALTGPLPSGYYKDPEKTARTFRTIGNRRYVIPGDWARVEADGRITLLGRGNHCINTAGEKVFPEEVEEALKTHPAVEDALVFGVPDETWGQAVTGIVRLSQGAEFDEAALRAHVHGLLAGYKTPKRIVVADQSLRAPNGKADYARARALAGEALGLPT